MRWRATGLPRSFAFQPRSVLGASPRAPTGAGSSPRTDKASKWPLKGNTISIIDVDLARVGAVNAEVARVLVGTSNPNVQTRPFIPSFTPDGRFIIVPNFRSNNVSIVDLARALAHDPGAEVARIALTRPGRSRSPAERLGGDVRWPLRGH